MLNELNITFSNEVSLPASSRPNYHRGKGQYALALDHFIATGKPQMEISCGNPKRRNTVATGFRTANKKGHYHVCVYERSNSVYVIREESCTEA